MDNGKTMLSLERIKIYIKKFWWIIAIGIVCGLLLVFFEIKSQKTVEGQDDQYSWKQTAVVRLNEEYGNISATAILGDFKAFLQTDKFEKLMAPEANGFNMGGISLAQVESSNSVNIITEQDTVDKAKESNDAVYKQLKAYLQEIYPGVELIAIDSAEVKVTIIDSAEGLNLKAILYLFFSVTISCFVVYCIMILDKKIVTKNEAKLCASYMNINDMISIKSDEVLLLKKWLETKLTENTQMSLIYGREMAFMQEKLKTLGMEVNGNISLGSITEILGESKDTRKFLIVKAGHIILTELEAINDKIELFNDSIEGLIFVE